MDTGVIYWEHGYNTILLVNLIIVVALFTCLRFFSGLISHIDARRELLVKDNPAFGVSVAGVAFALTVLLSGTVYGNPEAELVDSAISIGSYGIVGIVLMAVARIVFDKIALPHVSLRDEIVRGNVAVAIADTSNVIAAAVIIRALMLWVTDDSLSGLLALLGAYALSQAILTVATFLRLKWFSIIHKGRSLEEELAGGNIALALSFAGRKIGTAFALSVAAGQVAFEAFEIKSMVIPWVIASVIIIVALKAVSFVASRIILFKVDIFHEVLNQRNIAVGALHGIIYLSLAMLLAEI